MVKAKISPWKIIKFAVNFGKGQILRPQICRCGRKKPQWQHITATGGTIDSFDKVMSVSYNMIIYLLLLINRTFSPPHPCPILEFHISANRQFYWSRSDYRRDRRNGTKDAISWLDRFVFTDPVCLSLGISTVFCCCCCCCCCYYYFCCYCCSFCSWC